MVIAIPLSDKFALPKLALGLVVAGLLFAVVMEGAVWRRWQRDPWPPALACAFLLGLACATAAADRPLASVLGTHADYNGLLYYVPGIACFLAAAALIRTVRTLDRLVWAISVCTVPVVGYAFVQLAGLDPIPWSLTFDGRAFSTLGQPLVLGGYLATILPCLIWLASRRTGAERAALLAECAAVAVALIGTLTRGALLGAAAGLLVGVGLYGPRRLHGRSLVLAGIVTMIVVAAGAGAAWAAHATPSRLQSAITIEERVDLWRAAASMFIDRPLLGVGPDQFATHYGEHRPSSARGPQTVDEPPAATPHNELLTVLAAGGLVAGAPYIALWLFAFFRAMRAPPGAKRVAVAATAGGVAAYLVQAQFSIPDVSVNVVALTFLGTLFGLTSAPNGRRTASTMPRSRSLGGSLTAVRVLAGAALCASAIPLVAADAFDRIGLDRASGGSPAAVTRLQLAVRLDPLQAAYLDDLGAAQESSTRWGASPIEANRSAFGTYQRRLDRFGGTAADHLHAARAAAALASLDAMSPDVAESEIAQAERLDPKNPGLSSAVDGIAAGLVRRSKPSTR